MIVKKKVIVQKEEKVPHKKKQKIEERNQLVTISTRLGT